jgi:hypothetical protein
MKISQDTEFTGDIITGQNNKKFVLLNKTTNTDQDGNIFYEADAICITGVDDIRKYLYSQVSDPIFFKYQREELTKDDWLDSIKQIKNLEV